jgi:hypothetical protein
MAGNVIVKMLPFKLPSDNRSGGYNSKHIEYIGSRPGTDKSVTTESYEYQNTASAIYNLSPNDKYLAYIGTRPGVVTEGEQTEGEQTEGEHGVHPEKDHGLFSEYGVPDMSIIKSEIRALKKSPMYRLVISLTESTAADLGFDNKAKWETLIRSQINEVATGLKIPAGDMAWVAALHLKDGHPHVHLACWDRTDHPRYKGFVVIPKENLLKIRAGFTKAVYAERRTELYAAKNAGRDILMKMAKTDTDQVREFLKSSAPERNTVSMPAPSDASIRRLSTAIKELSEMMPNHGRMGYAFMPQDVKAKVDTIVAQMLTMPIYKNKLHDVTKVVRELTGQFTLQLDKIDSAEHKAEADISKRIAQSILSTAGGVKQDTIKASIHMMIPRLFAVQNPVNIGAGDTVRLFECIAAAGVDRTVALNIARKAVPSHLYAGMGQAAGKELTNAEQLIDHVYETPKGKVNVTNWERIVEKLNMTEKRILENHAKAEVQAVATASVGLMRSVFAMLQQPKAKNPLHNFFTKQHSGRDGKDGKKRDALYTRDELE